MKMRALQKISAMLAFVILATFSMNAQNLWFEDFDSGAIPGDFVTYDVDGLIPQGSYASVITDGWNVVNWQSQPSPVATSTSWYDPPGQSDDWMGTPGFFIPEAGYTFFWEAQSSDTDPQFQDGYRIVASTSGNSLADFQAGDELMVVDNEQNGSYASRSVSLDAYVGQTVYLAFHNNYNDGNLLWVDNIGISLPASSIDVSVQQTPIVEYAEIPLDQLDLIADAFTGEVFNTGIDELTNVVFTVYVDTIDADGNLVEIFSSESMPLASLAAGESMMMSSADIFTPEVATFHYITYEVTCDQIAEDGFADNNFSESRLFLVTESEISRAAFYFDGVLDDFAIFFFPLDNADAGIFVEGEIGNSFELTAQSTVDSIFISIQDPIGELYMKVYDFTGNVVGDVLGESERFMGDGTNGGFVSFAMECPLELAPGKYFASIHETLDGTANVIACNYYVTDGEQLAYDAATDTWTNFNWAPYMFVNFTSTVSAPTTSGFDTETQSLSATFTGTTDGAICDWQWTVDGVDAGSGSTLDYVFPAAGDYEVCVTASFDAAGYSETSCETVSVACALTVSATATATSATAEAADGTPDYSYEWFIGDVPISQTTATAINLIEGVEYTVVATDASGCEATTTVSTTTCTLSATVAENPGIPGNFQVFAEDGNPTFTYEWSNAATSPFTTYNAPEDLGPQWVIVTDSDGCTFTVDFIFTIIGIEEIQSIVDFNLYPNPASDVINLNIQFEETVSFSYEIYDLSGKMVLNSSAGNTQAQFETINVSGLANGVYMLKLNIDQQSVAERLIISK